MVSQNRGPPPLIVDPAARHSRNGRNRNKRPPECQQRSVILRAVALPGSSPCAGSLARAEYAAPHRERGPIHLLHLRRDGPRAIACPGRYREKASLAALPDE